MSRPGRVADYGRQIDRPGLLDFAPRLKSALVSRFQRRLLGAFGRLTPGSAPARAFARGARRAVGGFLYSLKVEINNRCPLSCRICYVRKGTTELSLSACRELCRSLRSCGVRFEILGGEPLLHPDLAAIIRSAKTEAVSPFISMYTNGSLATAGLCSEIRAAGLDAAIVSLVSHREAVHDACAGHPGTWAAAVEGIRRLSEAGLRVFTFTPILRDNLADVPDIREFVKDRLRASALFYQYIPRSRDDELNITPEDWGRVKRWLAARDSGHWDFVRRFDMLSGNSCSGGNFVLTVKADGSVQPCPFVDDVPMGSITEEDIWSIYKRRFRDERFREFKRLPPECGECSHRSVCGGGCRAAARFFGGYGRRDPKCPGPASRPITTAGFMDCVPTFF